MIRSVKEGLGTCPKIAIRIIVFDWTNNNNDNGDSTNDVWDSWPLCEYPACPDPVRKPAGTLEAVWTYMYLKEAALVKKRGLFSKGKRPL